MDYAIYTSDSLHDRLVDYNADSDDDVYKDWDSAKSRIKYFDIDDEFFDRGSVHYYFCCFSGDLLVGCLKLRFGGKDSIMNPGWNNWVSFISTDKDYANKGIATKLIDMVFEFCSEKEVDLLISSYSQEGWDFIRSKIHLSAEAHKVKFLENGDGPTYCF